MVGTVVSDKMDKTVIVLVERLVQHKLYKKYIRRRSKFAAHDENNVSHIGDKVLITQSRPLSKTKSLLKVETGSAYRMIFVIRKK